MYIWNDIAIRVHGSNKLFISQVAKYINAPFDSGYTGDADIEVFVSEDNSGFPKVPDSARLIRTIIYEDDFNSTLRIYNQDNRLWYIYEDLAEIYIDGNVNRMHVVLKGLPLEFEYYNILVFMFHPMGYLLEKFGFYRIHSSCCTIGRKSFLATGTSGSGKSTSAFAAQNFGGWIISDDLTYVKKTGGKYLAYSLSALVKLRDDSVSRFFPNLNSLEAVCRYKDETYFYIKDINRHHVPGNEIRGIGILRKTGQPESSYTPASPLDIVPEMFPSTIHTNNKESARIKFIFITDMLNESGCFKINFGTDMKSYYNQIREILGE